MNFRAFSICVVATFSSMALSNRWDFSEYVAPGPSCLNCCFSKAPKITKLCKGNEHVYEQYMRELGVKSPENSAPEGRLGKAVLLLISASDWNGALKKAPDVVGLFPDYIVFMSKIASIDEIYTDVNAVSYEYELPITLVNILAHADELEIGLGVEELSVENYDRLIPVFRMLDQDAKIVFTSCSASKERIKHELRMENIATFIALAAKGRRVYASPELVTVRAFKIDPKTLTPQALAHCYMEKDGQTVKCPAEP